MGAKLKFILNVAVVLLIFAAFRPTRTTAEDYGLTLVILAIAATIFEDLLVDLWRAKRNPSPADTRRRRVGTWGTALALAAAAASAVVVPAIHRNAEQEQASQERARDQERGQTSRILADPNVQQGLRVMQGLEAQRNAPAASTTQSTTSTTRAVNQVPPD